MILGFLFSYILLVSEKKKYLIDDIGRKYRMHRAKAFKEEIN
jgi:hypothetical protein